MSELDLETFLGLPDNDSNKNFSLVTQKPALVAKAGGARVF
jgi:hypothetical protein